MTPTRRRTRRLVGGRRRDRRREPRRTSRTRPRSRPSRSTTTASWTARSLARTSTSGCWSSPRTGRIPLLERARFLAIFASNLDEFFMVRVAGLKRRIAAGVAVKAASGLLPREVLEAIWAETGELTERHAAAVPRGDRARAARPRHRAGALGRPRPGRAEVLQAALQGAGLPGAHPARRRPGPPVPLHLRALAQPGGAGPQPQERQGALRPGEGAAELPALRRRSATSGSSRSRTSSGSTCGGCSPAWRCWRPTPSGSPATRTSRSRRTTPRTCWPRSRRSCCAGASVRRSGSRSRSRSPRRCSSCSSASSASPRTRCSGSPARST